MKRFITVLVGVLSLPAFAEVAPEYFYQDMLMQYSDDMPVESEIAEPVADETQQPTVPVAKQPVVPTTASPRNTSGRASASRAVATGGTTSSRNVSTRNNATPSRNVTVRTATTPTTVSRVNATRAATTRGATANASSRTSRATATNTVSSRPTTTVRATTTSATTTPGVTTRRASQNNNANTARATLVQTDTVNKPLYVTSRVGVASTNTVSARVPTIRATSSAATTTTTAATTTSSVTSMDELAQLTDFCKAQYTACMDNFCNVLDDNQGRCSCSANLSNYAETEAALKEATERLQDVAQQIQYIGLTADQVESLFTETAAEAELSGSTDNSQLMNSLESIRDMIIDVESGRARSNASSGLSFDLSGLLDFSLDSSGFDLASLFGNSGVDTSSISNQRGEDLYETAAARCKASVLNSCQSQGVDISVITNSYDLEIDKACIVYERSLTDANDQMSATVRNATSLLQRARLMVAEQKNAYDLRECVTELDSCMQDEFVCGRDYEYCLDPTGKYIVNGDVVVVVNQDTMMTKFWGASEPSGDRNFITAHMKEGVIELLLNKIGDPTENTGLCNAVLNRCQQQWENEQSGKYDTLNQVSLAYLEMIVPRMAKKQKEMIADFMANCKDSVYSCMSKTRVLGNVVPRPTQSVISFLGPRINACRTVIDSCTTILNISTKELLADWIPQNVCREYDFDNDVCSLSALMEQNCLNAGNLWIDGACQDSTAYYTKLASTYEELPSYCWPGVPVADWPGEEGQWDDCVDRCVELGDLLKDEPKPIPPYEYGYTWGPSPDNHPQCTGIGWLPGSLTDNAEFFCFAKGCFFNGTTRCISGYTRIFDPCGLGLQTADNFICCSPDKTDECVQQYCADE